MEIMNCLFGYCILMLLGLAFPARQKGGFVHGLVHSCSRPSSILHQPYTTHAYKHRTDMNKTASGDSLKPSSETLICLVRNSVSMNFGGYTPPYSTLKRGLYD
ncbi:hypothetical protein BS50DRAFT_2112 [Corynespora cassiicola Philippines]|uniref:Secreted protein n=1 Tax=Corynespora cassiicola Philippines TaxID=1448308 RepID=A0A2T2P892_CORCC|nr:hypothetical protein BS50DRAFT_2112 [Corynespora cassiicola Philippines]